MGLSGSSLSYEGYGRTRDEAARALEHMLRYHHGNVVVQKRKMRTVDFFYVYDGREHPIYFTRSNERIRAFL